VIILHPAETMPPLPSVFGADERSRSGSADLGGNLDRQSACRYRARTAVRLAAGGKQALASLTSLPLAGHASIAAARRFHAAAQIARRERS
jgi:hypothetical protein